MRYENWLFDGDGVLYIDGKRQPYAKETLLSLKSLDKHFALVSNNSTKTLNQYMEMVTSMDLPFQKDQIITSAYVATRFVKGNSVYIVGEEGIFDACTQAGFEIVNDTPGEPVDTVIVGMDRNFDYQKMTVAMRYIMAGSYFLGTNPDVNFPVKDGFTPGAGTMIAALETASEKKVDLIVGKPNGYLFEVALSSSHKAKAVMVGDRLDTDIIGAHKFGIDTILVRTGIGARYSEKDIEKFKENYGCPTYVVPNLEGLREEFLTY